MRSGKEISSGKMVTGQGTGNCPYCSSNLPGTGRYKKFIRLTGKNDPFFPNMKKSSQQ